MTSFALEGSSPDNPDDLHTLAIPAPLDQRVMRGPVSKEQREDLQVWSFLQACSLQHWFKDHPVGIQRGGDPPDYVLTQGDRAFGLELTQLTVESLRRNLADARHVGRSCEEQLNGDTDLYTHLRGRSIIIQVLGTKRINHRAAVEAICTRLRDDMGVFDGTVPSDGTGMPTSLRLPGMYGVVGNFLVRATIENATPDRIVVLPLAQLDIAISEIVTILNGLIVEKDEPGNDVLLISTSAIDGAGYINPADSILFRKVAAKLVPVTAQTSHIDAIMVHDAITSRVVMLGLRPGAKHPFAVGAVQ